MAADYPVSELDLHARHNWLVRRRTEITEQIRSQEAWCDPKVAAWWVWGISQWIGGGLVCRSPPAAPPAANRFDGRGVHRLGRRRSGVESLRRLYASLAARLERVNILSGDWSGAVTPAVTTRHGITGVFLDPPYTDKSGREDRLYARGRSQGRPRGPGLGGRPRRRPEAPHRPVWLRGRIPDAAELVGVRVEERRK